MDKGVKFREEILAEAERLVEISGPRGSGWVLHFGGCCDVMLGY